MLAVPNQPDFSDPRSYEEPVPQVTFSIDECIVAPSYSGHNLSLLSVHDGSSLLKIPVECRFWQPYILGSSLSLKLWISTYDSITYLWDFSGLYAPDPTLRRRSYRSHGKCNQNAGITALNEHMVVHGTGNDSRLLLFDLFSPCFVSGSEERVVEANREFVVESLPATFVLGVPEENRIPAGRIYMTSQNKPHVGCWDCEREAPLGMSSRVGDHRSSPVFMKSVGCVATAVYGTGSSRLLLWDPRLFDNDASPVLEVSLANIACSLDRVSDHSAAVGEAGGLDIIDVRTMTKTISKVTHQSYPYGCCRVILPEDPTPKVVLTAIDPKVAMFDTLTGKSLWVSEDKERSACFGIAYLGEKDGPLTTTGRVEELKAESERIDFVREMCRETLIVRFTGGSELELWIWPFGNE